MRPEILRVRLENKSFASAFGPRSAAPYLARTLPAQGALLENYYAIGHWSLLNYLAMISAQPPNPASQRDCLDVTNFRMFKPALYAQGQAAGVGCVYIRPSSRRYRISSRRPGSPGKATWKISGIRSCGPSRTSLASAIWVTPAIQACAPSGRTSSRGGRAPAACARRGSGLQSARRRCAAEDVPRFR